MDWLFRNSFTESFFRVETKRENLHKVLELGQFENSTFLSAHPFHASWQYEILEKLVRCFVTVHE